MPPKKGAKKGKKGGDDAFWDNAGESIPPAAAAAAADLSDVEDRPANKSKASLSGFAALSMNDDEPAEEPAAEDEDFGGLMSALKANNKPGKKDKKKKKAVAYDYDEDNPVSDGEGGAATPGKGAVEVTAEDLADEEWGPVKEKVKKGKKGKGKKAAKDLDEDEDDSKPTTPAPAASAALPAETPSVVPDAAAEDDGDEPEETGTKPLSKKEKEKLKKEREKAKKKAQAAAKKAAEGGDEPAPAAAAPSQPAAETTAEPAAEGDDGEGEEGAAAGASKNKKKKKKAGKKEDEPAPAPAPKKGGKISALRALMDEKKRIEEEARRLEEEARRIAEEEEARLEEEERKKEEEKARRKEKEKAKREIAKKEGRLLTRKQKEDKAMAERRKEALLASGAKIEGLQAPSGSALAPKKVVYASRKKKGPAVKEAEASPVPESRPLSPEAKEEKEDGDDWDASSDDEPPAPPSAAPEGDDVKDDWDASSAEEEEVKPAAPALTPAPAPSKAETKKPAAKAAPAKKGPAAKSTSAPAKSAPGAKPAAGKPTAKPSGKAPAPVEESSSEEDSDDDDDSDDSGSGSDSDDSDDDSDDDSSSDEELTQTQRIAAQRKADAAARREASRAAAIAAGSRDDLRSPICCILGHVDTGKTKLLDKIRQTNVQEGEAGGITQQIGATYFPVDAIKTKTLVLNKDGLNEYKIPGLLVIDTPGHESFTNLRSRGSSLCNIAVLVVDIMHGLEPQTLESLKLLRDRKTPFIVALNKIDRMYGWNPTPDGAFQESLAKQDKSVQREFADRVEKTILAFAEQGLNSVLYYDNKNLGKNVSLVPTSAVTGEGVPDMIMLLVNLTQQRMSDRLMYLSELECTVLEVKVIEGLGTTIDVVLSNGVLREGDRIVLCGLNGPIVTTVRALLTPEPLRELRIKSAYVHHKEVKAALGVKITAPDLEKAIAGSRLLVCGPDDDEDDLREEIMSDLTSLLNSIDKSGRGVCVQASTLGSLEALLEFLRTSKIPVSGINIGPVHKKDVMRAATMLEKAKELSVILCFDVTVDKDAERMAEEMGVRLFKADIIYHLFDAFTAYNAEIVEAKRKDAAPSAVWPCRLKIIAAFCKREPIILGVDILDGTLRVGTPMAVVKVDATTGKKDIIDLGKITSLEINHKTFDIVKKSQAGAGVAIKIEHAVYQSAKMFGRHFDDKDELLSHVTRQSIDVLKNSFKKDVSNEEWVLIKALKPKFNIS